MTKRLLALLLVLSVLSPATAAIATAQQDDIVRSADLSIQEPHYEDGDINRQTDNGTEIYVVDGEQLEIAPRNFETSGVVDFGVRSGSGTLTYDGNFDSYTLNAENGTGTYRLYWRVNEEVTVTNSTGNQTTNETRMSTVQYEALVRVDGGTNLQHIPISQNEELKEDAGKWREFNATLQSSGLVEKGVSVQTTVQEMINWYQVRKDPLAALTGNFTAVIIIMVSTIGGGLVLLSLGAYHQAIVQRLYRKLNIHRSIEAEEGTAKENIEELEFKERMQALWNMDWQDIHADDHVASAFRDDLGETVGEGAEEFMSLFQPRNMIRNRIQAMGHDGYRCVVGRRTVTDGGDDPETTITEARIEPATSIPEGADTVNPADADEETIEEILDCIDWDSTTIRTFDLPSADYDAHDLDETYESMDLDQLIEEMRADMRHFDSKGTWGEYMKEFIESVREHPFTDEHGRPDELRYTMSQFLETAQLLDDRWDFPMMHYYAEAFERALVDEDPESDAMDVVEKVRREGA